MVREDILGGLKNAVERGESLEEAKSSFITAGYSSFEVEEAARVLEETKALPVPKPGIPPVKIPAAATPVPIQTLAPLPVISAPQAFAHPEKRKKIPLLITGIAISIVFLIVFWLLLKFKVI